MLYVDKYCTMAEFIEQHQDVFVVLVRSGVVPPSFLHYYKVFLFYKGLSNIKSKMLRYTFCAEQMGVSERTVRNAVHEMKKRVKMPDPQ